MKEYYLSEDRIWFNTKEEATKHGTAYRIIRPGHKLYPRPTEAKDKGKQEATAIRSKSASVTEPAPPVAERPRKRRRKAPKQPVPLTPRQAEAVHLVGEHKGNMAAAARAAGVSRPAIEKLYRKAMGKLGKKAVEKIKTQALPIDKRGQVNLAANDETD
jgi:predicted DNA-binding protein (UPF0251 family)